MEKFKSVLIVTEEGQDISELIGGAKELGEQITVLQCAVGDCETYLSYLPGIVAAILERKPQLVLTAATKNGRLTAAAVAAATNTCALTECKELTVSDGALVSRRMTYGGAAWRTEKASGEIVCACVGPGTFEPAQADGCETVSVEPVETRVKLVGKRPKETHSVNLSAAKTVVGVGRGVGTLDNVQLVRDLAEAIGGELSCSRPVAEENKWLPRENYTGVTGVMIKPNVYVACGISGQVQHMVGVNQSKLIVAINKDKSAPIFRQCDFGFVGDVIKVLPELTAKFKG